MKKNVPFVVRAELASPVIVGQRLTLDALLSGLLSRAAGQIVEGDELPLSFCNGIAEASAALIEGYRDDATVYGANTHIRALRPLLEVNTRVVKPGTRRGKPFIQLIKAGSGDYANKLTLYTTISTPALWWRAVGDIDRVREILETMAFFIGAKNNAGFGQVARWDVEPINDGTVWPGWLDDDGALIRPVPVDVLDHELQRAHEAPKAVERFQAPYWKGEQKLCYVPGSHPPVRSAETLRRTLGI